MYWLLLPPSANTQRHLEDADVPSHVLWNNSIRAAWAWIGAYLARHH